MTLLDTLLQPFQFEFMRYALIISVLVAIPTALLSCFLVLKGWSLMGDAISHAVLPGVVLAYIVGIPLGIVLYTSIQTDVHLDHILFGDILGVSPGDLIQTGIIAAIVVAIIAAKWRDLLLFVFDPQQAGAIGLPVGWLHYGLLSLLSLTVVAALTAVGIVLVIALLVAPGAIAFLISKRFGPMMLIAVTVSVLSSLVGIYLSFFIDSAPAPTIVLLMSTTFIVTFVVTTTRRPAALATS